jgi:tetratricopeptide (TPR) repeat protein
MRRRISAASEGNALYVEEMVAMVRERAGKEELSVPPTIHALLQARLDLLGDGERLLVGHAAVEGEVFHRATVAALVPAEAHDTLDDQLAALVRKELIRPASALLPGEEAYRFRHLLIRDAAYAALSKELRAELHERLAEWLEASGSDTTFELDEILGYHLEQAVRLRAELGLRRDIDQDLAGRAGEKLVNAGRGALGRADYAAAVALLQRGVDLLPDQSTLRLESATDLALALVRRGELERAEQLIRATIEEATASGNASVEARARIANNRLRTRIDPAANVEEELAEAIGFLDGLEQVGDLPNLSRVYTEIGMCRFMLGHAGEGEADLERAAAFARKAGDRALEREAATARLRPIAWGPTPAAEGVAYCTAMLESDLATAAEQAHALQVRGLCAALLGDLDVATTSASRSWALIEEFGLTLQGALYSMDVGSAHALGGDFDEAERVLRRGHDRLLEMGDTGARCTVDAMLADVLFSLGRLDEAAELASESRDIASVDDLDAQPRWRAALAKVLAARGEHAEAESLALEAVSLVEPIDLLLVKAGVFDALGEVLGAAGKRQEARAALERAIALHEQKGNVVWAARSRAAVDALGAPRPS